MKVFKLKHKLSFKYSLMSMHACIMTQKIEMQEFKVVGIE